MPIHNTTFLLCRADGRLCALPAKSVIETMRPLSLTPISKAPSFVLGVSIIRGAALPVVDLGLLLSGRCAQAKRFITVRVGASQVALAVEEVLGIQRLQPQSMQSLPPLLSGARSDAIASIEVLDKELLFVLEASLLVPGGLLAELVAERPSS